LATFAKQTGQLRLQRFVRSMTARRGALSSSSSTAGELDAKIRAFHSSSLWWRRASERIRFSMPA
jgi:hypothetical protein